MIKRILNLFENNYKPILGRWNHTNNLYELNRKIYLANHDHCGPCGNLELKTEPNLKRRRVPKYLMMKLRDLLDTKDKKATHRMINMSN